jgi:NAD(P)H-hydrate epimerase
VTLAVPEPLHTSIAGVFLEATWLPLPHEEGWISESAHSIILEDIKRTSSLVIGPGIGVEPVTKRFIKNLLKEGGDDLPGLVVDADGLKILTEIAGWGDMLPSNAVLTPHPGEMAGMTGEAVGDINQNRVEMAESYAKEWGHIIVLKGSFTVIAAPDGNTAIIPIATPALARAGTGDVLAGLIGGFLAQGLDPYHAAVVGAWIHGQAGLRAADDFGSSAAVLAGDVLESVIGVIASLDANNHMN